MLRHRCSVGTPGETLKYSYTFAEFAVQPFREARTVTAPPVTSQKGSYNLHLEGFRANRFWIRPTSILTADKAAAEPTPSGYESLVADFEPAANFPLSNTHQVTFSGGTVSDVTYTVDPCVLAADNTGIFYGTQTVTVTRQNDYHTAGVEGVDGQWVCAAHHYMPVCCDPTKVAITGTDVTGSPGILTLNDYGGFWIDEFRYRRRSIAECTRHGFGVTARGCRLRRHGRNSTMPNGCTAPWATDHRLRTLFARSVTANRLPLNEWYYSRGQVTHEMSFRPYSP